MYDIFVYSDIFDKCIQYTNMDNRYCRLGIPVIVFQRLCWIKDNVKSLKVL